MRRVLLLDSLTAAALVVFVEYAVRQPWDDGHRGGSLALNVPLVALVVLPMALRRTRPRLALLAMLLAMGVPSLLVEHDLLFWGGFLPLVVTVYTVARLDGGWAGRWCWLVAPVLFAVEVVHFPELRTLNEVGFDTLAVLAPWATGRGMRRLDDQERELSAALAALAGQRGTREAAAVVRERARIAAEMHDVVAHAVSLMVLQVGAARFEVESAGASPAAAGQLRAAESAGRGALDQLRRSLAVLGRGSS